MGKISESAGQARRLVVSICAAGLISVGWAAIAYGQALPGPVAPGRIEQPLQIQPAPPPVGGGGAIPSLPGGVQAPPGAESTRFVLRQVRVTGVTVYPADAFAGLYQDQIGKEVTLAQVYSVAQAITARYRGDGYILSQAVVPAQQIANGNVEIRVVEGFVDKVIVKDEQGGTGGDHGLVDDYARNISASRPLKAVDLERYLLLMNDLPGVSARSFLQPSATTPGAADLTVVLVEKAYDGYVSTDNLGSRFVGTGEYALGADLNNALGIYDRTGVRYVGTYHFRELHYGEINHQEQLDSEGTRLDLTVFRSESKPGNTLSSLNIDSLNWTGSAQVSHPFIRSRTENLSANARFDVENIDVTQAGTVTTTDRIRVLRGGGSYDVVDAILDAPAVNIVDAEVSQGLPIFDATGRNSSHPSRAGPTSTFTKITADVSRQQSIVDNWAILVAGTGQYGFNNLLTTEQFGVGGALFGRGYDSSQILGDSGVAGKVELQYGEALGFEWLQSYQAFAFYDAGYVENQGSVFTSTVRKHQHLQSAGVGVRTNVTQSVSGFVEAAKQLSKSAAVQGESGTAWVGLAGLVIRF